MLYTVLVLKKFVESFRNDCRTKKLTVRDFTYVAEHAGTGLTKIEKLEADLQETVVRWVTPVPVILFSFSSRLASVLTCVSACMCLWVCLRGPSGAPARSVHPEVCGLVLGVAPPEGTRMTAKT